MYVAIINKKVITEFSGKKDAQEWLETVVKKALKREQDIWKTSSGYNIDWHEYWVEEVII